EQRRADRTFTDRKKFVRAALEITECEFRRSPHLQPRAVAVVPRRRSVQANLGLQLDLCNPLQRLAQNFGLELQLPLVRNVLVMAAAALPEVRAASLDAIGRRFD